MLKDVRILTLNCWGLPDIITGAIYGSNYGKYSSRKERIRKIGLKLAEKAQTDSLEIVALQELWLDDDKKALDQILIPFFPYVRHYIAGFVLWEGSPFKGKLMHKDELDSLVHFQLN